jgi:hypothetical protein
MLLWSKVKQRIGYWHFWLRSCRKDGESKRPGWFPAQARRESALLPVGFMVTSAVAFLRPAIRRFVLKQLFSAGVQ